MKKLLCTILVFSLILGILSGCGKGNNSSNESFVKPDNYASVVTVTINPQFRLYLSTTNEVLALEAVNEDAKSIQNNIFFENKKVEEVVESLVVASNNGGFIKENAKIDIKITEIKIESVNAEEILNTVKEKTSEKLQELNIIAETITVIENTRDDESSSTENNNSTVENNFSIGDTTCHHSTKKYTPTNTGNHIIDDTGYDVIKHRISCKTCDTDLGLEDHIVANDKCTACGQDNFRVTWIKASHCGIITSDAFNQAAIRDDGKFDYDMVLSHCWNGQNIMEFQHEEEGKIYYKIPESVILNNIRKDYVFSDTDFANLKAQGIYHFRCSEHTYNDGFFIFNIQPINVSINYLHDIVDFKDDQAGKLEVYIDYRKMLGPEESDESEHIFYYKVVYNYSGYSNFHVKDIYIWGYMPVLYSLRITSIEKVSSIYDIANN